MARALAGALLLCCTTLAPLAAQDPMAGMPMPPMTAMPGPLGISMNRMGSGTTWIPDAVSLPSVHATAGGWDLLLHGWLFLQYDAQGGPRGDEQVGSLNWAMLMASHALAGGRIQARTMLSLDPATVTARGYPLLVQSGESYQGQPLYDRQHPHDFWMELGLLYERAVSRGSGVSLYVAPSGEPALGPVAFMHRPSATDNPFAPLSHHWQDATHISYGVVSAGLFGRRWKLEGSAFNGREPDDDRWGFDPIRLDSYSGRLTMNPSAGWSFTAGYGYLRSPEAADPGVSAHRFVASALHGRRLGAHGSWSSALVWGVNRAAGASSSAWLAESQVMLDRHSTLLARAELVEKSAEDLALPGGVGGFAPDSTIRVAALSAGYIREIVRFRGATLGLGAVGTLNFLPAALEPFYGSRTPGGGMIFLRLRPVHGTTDQAATEHGPGHR